MLSECASIPISDFPQPFAAIAAPGDFERHTAEARPVVLDVCCGAGTLGLVLARQSGFSQVLGVESCASAVEDARLNAKTNGLADIATFVCGPAELKIDELLQDLKQQKEPGAGAEVIAIVYPPRTGLKPSVCAALRAQPSIRRVLFVSCNPHGHNMRFDYTVKVTAKCMLANSLLETLQQRKLRTYSGSYCGRAVL
eukprot:COSAG02_NODE_15323_length_1182_cov_0.879963_2_plen_197_part_00